MLPTAPVHTAREPNIGLLHIIDVAKEQHDCGHGGHNGTQADPDQDQADRCAMPTTPREK